MRVGELLKQSEKKLHAAGVTTPYLDALILIAHSLNSSKARILSALENGFPEDKISYFQKLLARREKREPLAYILGTKEFWSLDLHVTPDVLIPRPETEILVETILSRLKKFVGANNHLGDRQSPLLEIGTGSGAITIALLNELPNAHVTATDISESALTVAKKNAQIHQVQNRATFIQTDLYHGIEANHQFDVVCSNPPYLRTKDIETATNEVKIYEPHLALDGGADGLRYLKPLIQDVHNYLKKDGFFIFEICPEIVPDLLSFCKSYENGFQFEILKDYYDHDRFILGTLKA